MTELLRLCGAALICAFAGLLLSRWQGEYGALVRLGGVLMILAILLGRMGQGITEVAALLESAAVAPYAQIMLRALGIALLSHLCGALCRECGAAGLSAGVELGGKLMILLLCLPLIEDVLSLAEQIFQMGE